jgi:hypothetical protein
MSALQEAERKSPPPQARRCAVCNAMLPCHAGPGGHALEPYPVCHAVACRMVVSRRAEMGEANFRHYLAVQVQNRQYITARTAAQAARELAESRENGAAWDALRARLPAMPEPEPLPLLLPTGPRRSRRVPQARRARYRLHLLRIIGEARALPAGEAPAAAAAEGASGGSGMAGRLCAFCGGGCCTMGGEQAYLSAETMRRFMDGHPGWSDEEVLQAYLGRVATTTRAGSCINQTAAGCSLPREMRSDICNRFSCEPLARLEAARRGPQPVQTVLIVRRQQDHWRRAESARDNAVNACAVMRETGLRRFPPAVLATPLDNQAEGVASGTKTLQR